MKRGWITQAALLAAAGLVLWFFASNTAHNLETRKIASGFGFLWREAGFEIGETGAIAYSAADSYLRALGIGLLEHLSRGRDRGGVRHRCSAR